MQISINKAVSCRSGGCRCSGDLLLSAHHGGEGKEVWSPERRRLPRLQQGSLASSRRLHTASLSPYLLAGRQPLHRRFTTAPLSPFSMAERRPLHPRVTAIARPQGISNLRQALMPIRRLSCFVGVNSHLCAPSGLVPGGVEADSGELCRGGKGVGPDRVSEFYLRVLSAICKGQAVIFLLFLGPLCKMYSTVYE
jgi:hypothetical protein